MRLSDSDAVLGGLIRDIALCHQIAIKDMLVIALFLSRVTVMTTCSARVQQGHFSSNSVLFAILTACSCAIRRVMFLAPRVRYQNRPEHADYIVTLTGN